MCWPSRGFQLPWALTIFNHFFAVLPSKRPQKGITQSPQHWSPISSLFLPLARISILILMSRNIYLNPGPMFPCLVCVGNVIWRGRSMQCCTCSKRILLRCSLSSFKFNDVAALTREIASPAAFLLFRGFPSIQCLTSSLSEPSQHTYLHCSIYSF